MDTESRSRPQHYYFAHRALPALFFANPNKFISILEGGGRRYLQVLWARAGETAESGQQLPGEGLDLQVSYLDPETRLAVVSLPPPERTPEAYFLGLLHRPARIVPVRIMPSLTRCYTLEFGINPSGEIPTQYFCEWMSDLKTHRNHQPVPEPTREGFIKLIRECMAEGGKN